MARTLRMQLLCSLLRTDPGLSDEEEGKISATEAAGKTNIRTDAKEDKE